MGWFFDTLQWREYLNSAGTVTCQPWLGAHGWPSARFERMCARYARSAAVAVRLGFSLSPFHPPLLCAFVFPSPLRKRPRYSVQRLATDEGLAFFWPGACGWPRLQASPRYFSELFRSRACAKGNGAVGAGVRRRLARERGRK